MIALVELLALAAIPIALILLIAATIRRVRGR